MNLCAATVVCLALLGGSACSGSDGDSNDAAATSADTDIAVTNSVEAGAAESADADDNGSANDFCGAITAIQSAEFELDETFGPDARQLFDDVQSAAPPAIADDVATVIDALEELAAVGISTDDDDPEALDAAFEILVDPHFTEASENLEEYTSEACGIDLADGDDADFELDDVQDSTSPSLVE